MNKKRKRPRLPAALALLLLLCACGKDPTASFALENPGGDRLTLGMSRDAIDAMLTAEAGYSAQKTDPLTLVQYHGGTSGPVSVTYAPDDSGGQTAVSLTVGQPFGEPDGDPVWSIRGIVLGSSEEDIRGALGYPTLDHTKLQPTDITYPEAWNFLAYDYLADGTLLAADTNDSAFTLFFFLREGKVSCLSLYRKDQGPGFDPSEAFPSLYQGLPLDVP